MSLKKKTVKNKISSYFFYKTVLRRKRVELKKFQFDTHPFILVCFTSFLH